MPTTIHITDQGNQSISGNKNFYGDVLLSGANTRIGGTDYIEADPYFVSIKKYNGNIILGSEEYGLYDQDQIPSIFWSNRSLNDPFGIVALDWSTRSLYNQNGTPVLTWTGENIGVGTNTPSEKLQVIGNILGNNLVYNTGNQTISGIKTFNSRPTVNGTGVLLIGEGGGVVENVVYTTGNQTISGTKTFDVFPIVSGNKLITGLDLSSYLTSSSASSTYSTITNLASTGSTLDTKINNLSGYVTGVHATFASITNLGNTGSNLDTKINNVSGYFTGTNATFTTNLFSTGSTLDTKINTLSGYVTGANATFASITNLTSTGSTLDTKINNLSGVSVLTFSNQTISGTKTFLTGIVAPNLVYNTGEQFVSGLKKFDTRPTVNGTGVLLNGEASSATLPTTIVYTTGDQTISGVKNFAFRPTVNGTGVLLIGGAGTQGAPDIATTTNISSNTISLDLYNFSYFLINLNSNITTTNFNNPKAAPEVTSFVLQLSGDGTIRSVTWPTSLRWPGSTAPTITIGPNKVDTYSIFSYDGGVSYYGFPAGYNS